MAKMPTWRFLFLMCVSGLGDDQPSEIRKPRKIQIFAIGNLSPARSITKIVCGGMHSVALTSSGTVWTWGCNDDGPLGRDGAENTPLLVDQLTQKVTDIAAGDNHSIAYNTQTNQIFFWGCYKVSIISNLNFLYQVAK